MSIRDSIIAQAPAFYYFIKDFILDKMSWQTLNHLSEHDQVYVLSGVIRDFLTGDYDGSRDFDVVLLHGNLKDDEVLRFLRDSEFYKNSFGGIKIKHSNEVVDIWKLSDTWGLRKQKLEVTPESLLKTVFFNFSAIVYDFNNRKFIFDDTFCQFLQTRTMDIVYPENPNIPLCLLNTYHYAKRFGYCVSIRLARWVKMHYQDEYDFADTQRSHFGKVLYENEKLKEFFNHIINNVIMYKIEWDKYLCSDRYRSNSEFDQHKKNDEEKRNAFESDFGRVAFSSALRRMHDKTQVMPLTTGDSVHTRLTHSIEVMSIAYSLGINLCRDKEFVQLYGPEKAFEYERSIPMILKTAAFVHDIGNPPFGHFGEKIIQNYFREYLKRRIVTDEQALDFIHFDGNAEGFRILTRLQYIGDLSGLNLTYATLAAYCKYPNSGYLDKKYIGTKKHGVFTSESDILEKMVKACHMKTSEGKIKRHPLSFLVEAADSISYNVMDVEDGMTMGWYSFEALVKELNEYLSDLSGGKTTSVLKLLKLDFEKKGIDKNDQKRKMCDFRVSAIRYLVDLAVCNFKNNLESIDKGKYSNELIEDGDHLSVALQKFAKNNIFPQREIEQIELTGNSVINGLLDILLDCAFNPDKQFRNHLKSVISNTFLKVAQREDDPDSKPEDYKYVSKKDVQSLDIENLTPYSKLRTIVDLISGMTDRYAVSMFQKLSGQRLS